MCVSEGNVCVSEGNVCEELAVRCEHEGESEGERSHLCSLGLAASLA